MKKTVLIMGAAMLSMTLVENPAMASNATIKAANNQIKVQYIGQYVNYSENGVGTLGTQTGLLNTEKGTVPGFGVDLSAMLDNNLYIDLQYSRLNGHTNYVGMPSTGGTYGSVVGSSSATITDYKGRIGEAYALGSNFMLTPYLELGHHRWYRGINSGETYNNNYWGIGALAQTSIGNAFVLSGHLMYGRTFASHIDVAGSTGFSGGLGNAGTYNFGVSGDYAITSNLHANVGLDWTHFKYGISGIYLSGGYHVWEPNSTTDYSSVKLGLGWVF